MFDWSGYSNYAEVQRLKKNTILFRQGDRLGGFYYLQAGKVMISVLRADGYERIIDFVFPGSLIGEQMINHKDSFTTAKVLNNSTLYYFTAEQFDILSSEHPEASRQFELSLISKIRLLANINTVLNASVEVQLAHFLLNVLQKKGNETIELTQTSISKYIGKSRVSVWKVLKEWRDNGVLEINNQIIVVKDLDRLREIVHSS